MTKTAQILACIARLGDVTAAQIAHETGIPVKNIAGHLQGPIKRNLVKTCERSDGKRSYITYAVTGLYTPKKAEEFSDEPVSHIHGEDGRSLLSDEIPTLTQPNTSPAGCGAHNTGSSGTGLLTGTTSSPVAAASIQDDAEQRIDVIGQNGNEGLHYVAGNIHAEHAAELQAALDEIDRLKQELQAERDVKIVPPIAWMLRELQAYLERGIFVSIGEEYIHIGWGDNIYNIEPHEFGEYVSYCAALDKRLVA